MAMGPLKRNKTLVGKVRVSKWGWLIAMGPLKGNKILVGRVRVYKWGAGDGHGTLEKEQDSGWEGQGV